LSARFDSISDAIDSDVLVTLLTPGRRSDIRSRMPYLNARDVAPVEYEPGLFALKLVDGSRGSRNIALLRGWLAPGASHSPHTHDIEEAVIFLSGRGTLTIENERFLVGPGDAVLIPAGALHSTSNSEPAETLHFVAAFPDSVVRSRPATPGARHGRIGRARHHCTALWNRLRWITRRMVPR
jgi:quercetin dioxygenase-like cupin family protein